MASFAFRCAALRALTRNPPVKTYVRTMSGDSEVILERIGNKGVITLNRPKALNSLTLSMIRQIYPQLKAWDSDPEVKMVLIKGNGEKAFCAGGDVRALYDCRVSGDVKNANPFTEQFFREEYHLNNLIGTLQIPYVALIDGITMGGGIGLSVHGTFRVCTEKTLCAMPESTIGFFPDVGGSYFLPRLPGKIGLFLAMTSYRVKGRDVYKAGLATHFVTTDHLKDLETELMRLENPNLHDIDKVLLKFQLQCESDFKKEFALKQVMGRMNTCFSGHSVEQIFQNLEKDGSEWGKTQMETMRKMSPISLKVAFEQLKRGASMTLQEALKMEFRLSQRFMEDNDFGEGVRSVLVDRDNKPNWKPSSLEEVTDAKVESYFAPLTSKKELQL